MRLLLVYKKKKKKKILKYAGIGRRGCLKGLWGTSTPRNIPHKAAEINGLSREGSSPSAS